MAAHDPDCLITIEYKPNEPRSYAVLPDASTTLLAIAEIGLPNLGVTMDFANALCADEQPAFAAMLVQSRSCFLGLPLNDSYARRDDGLLVGAVRELATQELPRAVHRGGFDRAIYFDTVPNASGIDPVTKRAANIRTARRMREAVTRMEGDNRLAQARSLHTGFPVSRGRWRRAADFTEPLENLLKGRKPTQHFLKGALISWGGLQLFIVTLWGCPPIARWR